MKMLKRTQTNPGIRLYVDEANVQTRSHRAVRFIHLAFEADLTGREHDGSPGYALSRAAMHIGPLLSSFVSQHVDGVSSFLSVRLTDLVEKYYAITGSFRDRFETVRGSAPLHYLTSSLAPDRRSGKKGC